LLSGTFNNYYDIDRTREILEVLRKKLDIRIIWARAGESPLKTLGVGEDVIVTASHSKMPKIVRESHFGIAICKQGDLTSLSAAVPTKIGEFLASGRPVIVSSGIGDLDQMLSSTSTGVIIDQSDSLMEISQRIHEIISDPKTPDRCRELAMESFDMEKSIVRYLDIYERMLQ
jgi:glycosyltransferase involved in cell wall biosynthesis